MFYEILPLQFTLGSNEFGPSAVFHPVWHCVITLASTCVLWLHPSIPWPQPKAYPLAVLIKFYLILYQWYSHWTFDWRPFVMEKNSPLKYSNIQWIPLMVQVVLLERNHQHHQWHLWKPSARQSFEDRQTAWEQFRTIHYNDQMLEPNIQVVLLFGF